MSICLSEATDIFMRTCNISVRINVYPAVAAAFQLSDDFPVCHNCRY